VYKCQERRYILKKKPRLRRAYTYTCPHPMPRPITPKHGQNKKVTLYTLNSPTGLTHGPTQPAAGDAATHDATAAIATEAAIADLAPLARTPRGGGSGHDMASVDGANA
jgi:hypothetical protein